MVCSMHEHVEDEVDDELNGHEIAWSPGWLLLSPYSRRAVFAHVELALDDGAEASCETSVTCPGKAILEE